VVQHRSDRRLRKRAAAGGAHRLGAATRLSAGELGGLAQEWEEDAHAARTKRAYCADVAAFEARDLGARVGELEPTIARLRIDAQVHARERRAMASENLTLLHRARKPRLRSPCLARESLLARQPSRSAPALRHDGPKLNDVQQSDYSATTI
jgi:hypothetical protein